ncbi:unnamed protein product [Brassicogethes aeneus]|uniref:Fatty acid synthase n=1 Tax=Brassicogethes aeneus TaxID=1431903 RepID=A0A9P0BD54_BRAAE|nr:unnamed protein product [Brassicogethes aeneus]
MGSKIEIAISGVSGRFPQCCNIEEFKTALLENKVLLTENHDRWPTDLLGTPSTLGIVNDFDKFDAIFFAVPPKQAESCDPRTRKLLEVVYECIVDSGHSINEVKGSNTGLFLGVMQSYFEQPEDRSCIGVFNRSIALMANQISYTFDLKGTSYALDTGCSSAIYGIDQAVNYIRSGVMDSAIICSAQTHLLPYESAEFAQVPGILSSKNKCQPFDKNRSGYVKSEAVVSIFLKKSKDCRRIYATIQGIGTNVDGYKDDGLMHPSSDMQYSLLKSVYERYNVNPNDVFYMENHGTGTFIGDQVECRALQKFFCEKRSTPLHIGSVKSNVGHPEAASGLVGLVKLIVAIQSGFIPATVNIEEIADDIDGIKSGQLQVVRENLPYENGLLALNSFGYGGANAHLILKPHLRRNISLPINPSIVHVSGRTEESVRILLYKILENKSDPAFISLINQVFKKPIKNHDYRGFQVLSDTESRQISHFNLEKRPIWFCYSGMGSQWPGMAKDIIQIPIFRSTVEKCALALKPFNIDLVAIILNGTEETFNNCINCFVSVVAVSVGLTETLRSFGITPDGIFGHSLGEIVCAYADNLITAEEAILIAYARGYSTFKAETSPGLMAAIGMTLESLKNVLPKEIEVAAINSTDNITIAGPEKNIKEFVEKVSSKGIFARIVNTGNIAFHSSYVNKAGEILLGELKNIIKEPKLRSPKWLSTSVPKDEWGSEKDKYNSADYHCNNYLSPVLLKQVLDCVPKNAIIIEIAPRGLLQAILRRYLTPEITNISLLSNLQTDNMDFFLSSLGKVYLAGGNPDFSMIQTEHNYPVGINTASISPLIKWNHQITWALPKYRSKKTFGHVITIDLSKNENKYLLDHIVDGIGLFPAAGYAALVWEAFAFMHGKLKEDFAVEINNLKILNGIVLTENDVLKFVVNIFKNTGEFEILEKNKKVSSGYISMLRNEEFIQASSVKSDEDAFMARDEFYKMLKIRGYGHLNKFQGVMQYNFTSAHCGKILWLEKWIAFLDAIVTYLVIFQKDDFYIPNSIKDIIINPVLHKKLINENTLLTVNYNNYFNSANCGGVEIKQCSGKNVNKKNKVTPLLKSYTFTPYELPDVTEFEAITYVLQTVVENNLKSSKICIGDFNYFNDHEVVKSAIHPRYLPNLLFNFVDDITAQSLKNIQLLFHKEFCRQSMEHLHNIGTFLSKKSFIFTNIKTKEEECYLAKLNYIIVSRYLIKDEEYVLIRQKQETNKNTKKIITIHDNSFSWWDEFKAAIIDSKTLVYLVTSYCNSGIVGLFNSIREEYCCQNIRIYYIKDTNTEDFSLNSRFYEERINMDLTVNIYKNCTWGSYRFKNIEDINLKNVKYAALSKEKQQLLWREESSFNRSEQDEVLVLFAFIHKWQLQTIRTTNLALEYAGVDKNGSKIMGICPKGALKSYVDKHALLSWGIPESWDLSVASSMPLALAMTFYGLFICGHLVENNSILIYFENNYYTFSAIKFALKVTRNIYVCIEKDEDVNSFVNIFPKLRDNIILTNKKVILDEQIIKQTKGKGLDIIFNKVFGENTLLINRVTKFGKIIKINYENDLRERKNDLIINLEDLLNDKNLEYIHKEIQLIINTDFVNPEMQSRSEITHKNLNSYFQNNKEEHSVIVKVNEGQNHLVKAIAKTFFNSNKVYIVIGGLGGFALEMVDWMIKKGAQKIVINSRSHVKDGYQAAYLKQWAKKGATIILDTNNAASIEGGEALMITSNKLGDIGGIFNLALALEDDLSFKLTEEQFYSVVAPKLYVCENLDKISRIKCPNLDFFVVFSSMVSSLGNAGQANYAFANSAVEMLCENRKQQNLPAMAIQWGPIGDVGRVANSTKKILNASHQSIQSCLLTLDDLLQKSETIVSSSVYEIKDYTEERDPITTVLDSIGTLFGFKSTACVDMNSSLINLGMDSIMSFEIRNILMAEFNIDFSSSDLKNMSFSKIKNLQRKMSRRISRYM